jgi:hypothetical protein
VAEEDKISSRARRAIIVVFVVMALLAIYSNVQRFRREKLESAIVTPVETPSPSATAR